MNCPYCCFNQWIWGFIFFRKVWLRDQESESTLPETNIAPENGWLEYYFPFVMDYFQVLCQFQGVYPSHSFTSHCQRKKKCVSIYKYVYVYIIQNKSRWPQSQKIVLKKARKKQNDFFRPSTTRWYILIPLTPKRQSSHSLDVDQSPFK